MRLTGKDAPYQCWHVPTAQLVRGVIWVDDAAAMYATFDGMRDRQPVYSVHCAKCIRILTSVRVVLIDPLDDQVMVNPTTMVDVWVKPLPWCW